MDRETHSHTCVGNVDDSSDVRLDGSRRHEEVSLLAGVAEALDVVHAVEGCLLVGDSGVHKVLLAVAVDVDRDTLKDDLLLVLGVDGGWGEDGLLEAELLDTALDDRGLEGDDTGHLDGTAERELSVSLGVVEVSDREVGALNVDGEVAAGTAREVLDVDVTTVLTGRDGTGAFGVDLLALVLGNVLADIGTTGLRWEGDVVGTSTLLGGNEASLTLVPLVEELLAWSGTDESWVGDTSKPHTGNVTRGSVDTLKVPDSLGGLGVKVLSKQTTAVGLFKDTSVTPLHLWEGGDVENVDNEDISWLGTLHGNWAGEVVAAVKVDVLGDVSAIVRARA